MGYEWIGPVIEAGAGAVGGAAKTGADQQAADLQRDAYMRALAMLQGGGLNVQAQTAGNIGPSAMSGVNADPAAIAAQNQALQRLQSASATGYDTIDRAAINRALSDANINEKGQREAALARLDPNSGAALSARMGAQQSSANRGYQSTLDIAAAGRQRALAALGQYGNLASNMRGQSFNEGAAKAGAQDAIGKFNAETSRFNAGQANAMNQKNVGNQLDALGLAGGAGADYGKGISQVGQDQATMISGAGRGVSGAIQAGQNYPRQGNVATYTNPDGSSTTGTVTDEEDNK